MFILQSLRNECPQILVSGFLLNKRPHRWDMAIDEVGGVNHAAHLSFIANERGQVFHIVHIHQQIGPKQMHPVYNLFFVISQ